MIEKEIIEESGKYYRRIEKNLKGKELFFQNYSQRIVLFWNLTYQQIINSPKKARKREIITETKQNLENW